MRFRIRFWRWGKRSHPQSRWVTPERRSASPSEATADPAADRLQAPPGRPSLPERRSPRDPGARPPIIVPEKRQARRHQSVAPEILDAPPAAPAPVKEEPAATIETPSQAAEQPSLPGVEAGAAPDHVPGTPAAAVENEAMDSTKAAAMQGDEPALAPGSVPGEAIDAAAAAKTLDEGGYISEDGEEDDGEAAEDDEPLLPFDVASAPLRAAKAVQEDVECPNCGETLDERPIAQAPCSHCGKQIHVRAKQSIFRWGLVGEADVDAIDFQENVEPFGITAKSCRERMESLAAGRGGAKVPLEEAIWGLCDEYLEATPPGHTARLLNEMARFLQWQGKDFLHLRKRAEGAGLHRMKEGGVTEVRIVTRDDDACPACRKLTETVLPIDQALSVLPLPVQDCTKGGPCRCSYAALP